MPTDIEHSTSDIPSLLLLLGGDVTVSSSDIPSITELVECPECPPASEGAMVLWDLVAPTELSSLLPRDAIVVDAFFTEANLLSLIITVRIKSQGRNEVVYSDGVFAEKYAALSRVVPTADGRRFTIRPSDGWPRNTTDTPEDDIQVLVTGCTALPEESP